MAMPMGTQNITPPAGRATFRGRVAQCFCLMCIVVVSFVSGKFSAEASTGSRICLVHVPGLLHANMSSSNHSGANVDMPSKPRDNGNMSSNHSAAQVRMFVGVLSASSNRAKRDAVRQTWGSNPQLERVVFVMSLPEASMLESIRAEALAFDDIILLEHVQEHYYNITYQSLEVFRAAYAYHGRITHVLKCDDDSYIHVDRMLEFLGQHPLAASWAGSISTAYQPIRNPGDKAYVSKAEWPEDRSAIKWSNGPGYVLTMDLVRLLATGGVAKCAPGRLFKLEDIAVGSWLTCLEKHHNITLHLASDGRFNWLSCKEGDLLSHFMSPSQLRCMFAQGGTCCP